MPENVFEILRRDYPQLIITLDTNHDVCTFLMSAYAHILNIAQGISGDAKDIKVEATIERERLLIVRILLPSETGARTDVGDKLPRQRNLNLTKFLAVNKSVKDLALNITYLLDSWVEKTPWVKKGAFGFDAIRTFNSTLWRGDPPTITTELLVREQFDEFVESQLKMTSEGEAPEEDTKKKGETIQ